MSSRPFRRRDDQRVDQHIVRPLDGKQRVAHGVVLAMGEWTRGQDEEIDVGLQVIIAAALGADEEDLRDGERSAQHLGGGLDGIAVLRGLSEILPESHNLPLLASRTPPRALRDS
jgi:hypothetical protein